MTMNDDADAWALSISPEFSQAWTARGGDFNTESSFARAIGLNAFEKLYIKAVYRECFFYDFRVSTAASFLMNVIDNLHGGHGDLMILLDAYHIITNDGEYMNNYRVSRPVRDLIESNWAGWNMRISHRSIRTFLLRKMREHDDHGEVAERMRAFNLTQRRPECKAHVLPHEAYQNTWVHLRDSYLQKLQIIDEEEAAYLQTLQPLPPII